MNNKLRSVRYASIVGVLAANSLCAFTVSDARANAASYDIEEIVVTASRRAQNALLQPYMINVRDMQELQVERQVRTVPDALRDLPGVMIQKTGHGQGSPFIRGFTGLRTLFLIDGIRLNNSTFREGPNQYWNTVDPLSAHRLELVKGPTSVLYGSDAIGGTVNAVSRRFSDDRRDEGMHWRMYARGASAENSWVLRPEVGYAGERFEVMAAVSVKDFGDLEGGKEVGTQAMTGYDEQDFEFRLHFDLRENQQLRFAVQNVNQDDAWRVHKTIFGQSWEGTTTGDELRRALSQDRTLSYLQYHATDLASWIEELTVSLSYHDQSEERDRLRSNLRTDIQGTSVGTTGLFAQMTVPSRIGALTMGTEFYHDDVDSYRRDYNADGSLRSVSIQGPVADDATYLTAAAFLQDQFALSSRTDLTLGLRFTDTQADAKVVEDPDTGQQMRIKDDWSATTLSARFNHRLDVAGQSALFGGISQGFRAPNLSDLTRFDTARSNEFEVPVTSLESEDFLTYELGYKHDGDRWSTQVAAYYTDIRNMVIRTPTGRDVGGLLEITKRNSGDGYVRGIELQARYLLDAGWSVFGNFTWMDGEVDTYPTSAPERVREPVDRLMPLTALAGLRWNPETARWWVEGQVAWSDKQDRLSTRDAGDTDRIPPGGTPAFTVFGLRSGWQLSQAFSVSAAIENLFDEDYRIHGSGVNEPGRNFVVTLLWTP